MNKSYLYISNWKMELSFDQSCTYAREYRDSFVKLANTQNTQIILSPSFEALSSIKEQLKSTPITLCAQDCSAYKPGPYTGQVAAISLAQIGCTYCLIGHSERRLYADETTGDIEGKLEKLLQHGITPIICIGETEHEREKGKTVYALEQQLAPLLEIINHVTHPVKEVIIAYEPVWAIGSNKTPTNDELHDIFEVLDQWCSTDAPQVKCTLVYGGSVDQHVAKRIKSIELVGGFLIGRASLDFKKFESIVLS